MKKWHKKGTKRIAFREAESMQEPNLPMQIVHYPGHYGSFFGFSCDENSPIYLCSCSQTAIENYIRYRLGDPDRKNNSNPKKAFLISSAHFPADLVATLMKKQVEERESIFSELSFRESLCHECNKATPILGYCAPMYGGLFEHNFGWYINKQSFEFGIVPVSYRIIADVCQDAIFDACGLDKMNFILQLSAMPEHKLIMEVARNPDLKKLVRKLRNVIENEVRARFGFKPVGDAWANETLLYQLVSKLMKDDVVIRHCRPGFLEGLELDIFLPDRKIGIEYQGIQHFKVIQHWGGKSALANTKNRDLRKKRLCRDNGIQLVYFYYTESLSADLVKKKLMKNF